MPSQDRLRLAQRHEKLRDLMTQKVLSYVGRPATHGEKEFVAQEVDMLIHRGENSDASLKAIAKHIRSLTPAASQVSAPTQDALRKHEAASTGGAAARKGSRSKVSSHAPTSVVSAQRAADAQVKGMRVADKGSSVAGAGAALPPGVTAEMLASLDGEHSSRPRIPRPTELHKDDLWAQLAQKEVEEYHREALEERRKHKKLEAEQRLYLDQQVSFRQRKVVAQKTDEEKYVVEEVRQRDAWEEELKRKEAERKRRFAEEKASRDAQLEVARQRRAVEAAKRKQEDVEAAKKVQEQYEREQQAIRERRVKAKEEVVKAQEFNRQFEEMRSAERAKEKQRDLDHQRMFLQRLQKQDEERELALAKMHEKQRHQQQIAFQMQADFSEKAAEDEKRALQVKAAKEAAERERERKNAEKAAEAKVKQRQYLLLQMIEREEARKKEREDVEKQRTQLLSEQEAEERREAERKLLVKKKAVEHRRAVEAQMSASEARHRPVYMSDAERKLNVPLLKKVGLTPEPPQ